MARRVACTRSACGPSRTACSADGAIARRARAKRASGSVRSTVSSSCRSRCTRRSDRAGSRCWSEDAARPSRPAAGSFGSPVTLVAERCASSSPARRGSRRPSGARARGARRHGSRAGARRTAAGRRDLAPAGVDARDRRSARSAPRWPRRPPGVEVVYHIAAIYRQAGLSADTYRAVNADRRAASWSKRPARAGVRRVVHCSTVGVHGDIEHPPANEDAPLKPGDIYQATKLEGERAGARGRRAALGIEVTIARPTRHLRSRRSAPAEAVSRRRARRWFRRWAAAKSITI